MYFVFDNLLLLPVNVKKFHNVINHIFHYIHFSHLPLNVGKCDKLFVLCLTFV